MRIVTTDDGSKTLYSERYQQIYHSTYGAVTESQTVFVQGSRLQRYLQNKSAQNQPVRILEIGFGLALNFLLSADLAAQPVKQNQTQLAYTAIENDPVCTTLLEQLDYRTQLSHPEIADKLWPHLNQLGQSDQSANPPANSIEAQPLVNGICLQVKKILTLPDPTLTHPFDIVYLDAFSPDTNPECWEPAMLASLYELMAMNGTLVTYSSKGSVRRGLLNCGFTVEKLPGPPGKREFLRAMKT